MIGRRTLVAGLVMAAGLRAAAAETLAAQLARIEATTGGRMGVAVLGTATGRSVAHRGAEAFPMCSTFKLLLAGHVLARVDAGQEGLDRRVTYARADLVPYSPATEPRMAAGMTVGELCAATVTLSDNTAANLLLARCGGPAGLTAFLRRIGDRTTRLDRNEPSLNSAIPGDPRDTTTPEAMLGSIKALALDDALSAGSRGQLVAWLKDNKTGDAKLRARLPAGWQVGDKTGSGANGTNNDVGLLWPPGRAPILVTAYVTGTSSPREATDAAIAAVGAAIAG